MNKLKQHRPMFYNTVLSPFFEPFREWFSVKVILFFTFVIAQVSGFFELFETEMGYLYLLGSLMVLDAIGKSVRVIFTKGFSCWDWDLFIRKSLYKGTSYVIVALAFIMFSNQFEADSSHLEYGAYLGLSSLELFSIARHFKMVGYIVAFAKQIASGKIDFEKLSEEAEKYEITKNNDMNRG